MEFGGISATLRKSSFVVRFLCGGSIASKETQPMKRFILAAGLAIATFAFAGDASADSGYYRNGYHSGYYGHRYGYAPPYYRGYYGSPYRYYGPRYVAPYYGYRWYGYPTYGYPYDYVQPGVSFGFSIVR
jgi:hypothetical protein